ncbi:hypothetical protein L195_g035958 [Trifolium pratense]|uniref:Uncharacterized protein n=1 Tax=Trifolium pratense TaxID=57577 RepID=A0A2K3LN53_TRIPR|nr:hypothetical protein L195_g035958 [Trifolium pratense]
MILQKLWCRQRQECVNHRAMDTKVHVLVTTTVHLFAGMKVSLAEDAEDFAIVAFAPSFVKNINGFEPLM